jgi:hypothetical protein
VRPGTRLKQRCYFKPTFNNQYFGNDTDNAGRTVAVGIVIRDGSIELVPPNPITCAVGLGANPSPWRHRTGRRRHVRAGGGAGGGRATTGRPFGMPKRPFGMPNR